VTLTTISGAGRLRSQLGEKVHGLANWQSKEFKSPNGDWLRITAVPSQHYQRPLFKCLVGETNGFVIEWGDPLYPSTLYLSGDTVDFDGLDEIGKRFKIDTGFMHLGGVKFGLTGPLRYTLNAEEAGALALRLKIKRLIPIHYAGWTHFRESFTVHQKQLLAPNGEYELVILERGTGYTFK
jgi:L-ascorbate metabolism protein UlaG (beta-lactamase superfamily)